MVYKSQVETKPRTLRCTKQRMNVFSFIGKANGNLGKVSLFIVLLMRLLKTGNEQWHFPENAIYIRYRKIPLHSLFYVTGLPGDAAFLAHRGTPGTHRRAPKRSEMD